MELALSRTKHIAFFCIIVFLLCIQSALAYSADNADIHIESAPSWVEYRNLEPIVDIPVDTISNGVFYRLLDKQIQITKSGVRTSYARYIESITNQTGVESSSQINLTFDPSYQKVSLNSLTVIRDGQSIDKLNSSKITMLNSENKLDDQIYHGSLTMNILVDDVRIGDTLDYSFTRYGANPVYSGIFSFSHFINWSVPVHDQFLKILWGKSKPLLITTRNSTPVIEQKKRDEFTHYQIHIHNADIIDLPSQTPDWYSPYSVTYFNELESWEDVVSWARPLYTIDAIPPEVKDIANNIKNQHADKSLQIVAALKYAQDHIRYVALQNGINSHLPTPPSETLALRYGDCKDKAVLLISILKALGIESYPALVDTEQTKLLNEKPPAINLFDHVLVTLIHEEKRIWLDPTLRFQEGSLPNIYQPDYGYALLVKSGENNLTSMRNEGKNSYTHISEQFVIQKEVNKPATLKVVSDYSGSKALSKFNQLEQDGKTNLSKDYEVYYQRTYPDLTATSELAVSSNKVSGVLTLTENYSINNFWTKKDNDYEMDFYPIEIRDALFKPKQTNRDTPLYLAYPNNIHNQIKVTFKEEGWGFESEEFIEDNDYFLFKKNVNFANNILSVDYEYKAKSDHIPANKIEEYVAARTRVHDEAYYGILKYGETKETPEETISTYPLWIKVTGVLYLLGLGVIIVSWRLESKARPIFTDSKFYPISLSKFLTLAIITFGIYTSYWMYRNWKAIKREKELQIMPIARGIFTAFWFYPLFNHLKKDSIDRYSKNKVMPVFIAVVFAIIYFIISVVAQRTEVFTLTVLSIVLPVLFIPLVNYINAVNLISADSSDNSDSYEYNSTWAVRHIIAILICLPLLSLTLASESPLLPNDGIVTENDIMKHDLKFLHRNKIVPPAETITYFYSDAFLTIQNDGNGFTEKRVFSFWLDEKDQLNTEVAIFEDVKNIDVKYAKKSDDNTVITITRTDETTFMLFVSAVEGDDKLFFNTLKELWEKAK